MNADLHASLTKHVALSIGWRGDTNALAKAAILPDTVRVVEGLGIGAHLLGHNLASLTHFCRPIREGEVVFRGYNYHRDRSLPDLNLPDHDVLPRPRHWPDALTDEEKARDPLAVIVEGAERRGDCMALDELTFPTAANMAAWLEGCAAGKPWPAFDVIAGMICHFVQDCAVPHHAMGLLADGHQAFEGELSERYGKISRSRELEQTIDAALLAFDTGPKLTTRKICEDTAADAETSMPRLVCYRSLWHRGWMTLVEDTLFRAARATTFALASLAILSPKG